MMSTIGGYIYRYRCIQRCLKPCEVDSKATEFHHSTRAAGQATHREGGGGLTQEGGVPQALYIYIVKYMYVYLSMWTDVYMDMDMYSQVYSPGRLWSRTQDGRMFNNT